MVLPDPKLPGDTSYGGDVQLVLAEMLDVIVKGIASHERSAQKRIGPSEIGTPCARKLGAKIAGFDNGNDGGTSWRAFVGTAIHEKIETFFDAQNGLWPDQQRYATEQKVEAGTIDGETIDGSCDLFDMICGVVVDWKTTSQAKLKAYRRNGPGETYRVQAHSYGRGWENGGHHVEHVAIVFFPRDGNLEDAYWWTEPYDRTVAEQAFARADAIAAGQRLLGAEVFQRSLPATEDHCEYCPIYSPGTQGYSDVRKCGGAAPKPIQSSRPSGLDKLVGN
jgi:hypothetical protein